MRTGQGSLGSVFAVETVLRMESLADPALVDSTRRLARVVEDSRPLPCSEYSERERRYFFCISGCVTSFVAVMESTDTRMQLGPRLSFGSLEIFDRTGCI